MRMTSACGALGATADGDKLARMSSPERMVPGAVLGGRYVIDRLVSEGGMGAIYRATEAGYVLADYRAVPPRAEPTFASVVQATPGAAPPMRLRSSPWPSSSRSSPPEPSRRSEK